MEFSEEKTNRSNRFSFKNDVFSRWANPDFRKILNEIFRMRDFYREKVSLIERPENESMDGGNGLNCWNSAGSNLLCEGQFPK
jgi:hypothetical protein